MAVIEAQATQRVVLVDICSVCECIVGHETVVEMTTEDINKEKERDAVSFFARKDVAKKAQYRQIFIIPTCGHC